MELVENDIKYRMCDGLALRLDCGFAHSNLNYMRKYYLVSQKIQTSGFFKRSLQSF